MHETVLLLTFKRNHNHNFFFKAKVTMEEQKEMLLGALLNGDINRDEYAKELKSIEDIMLVSICVC